MKRLIITRHAKSSWKEIGLRDIDRPLNKRGRRDAPMMAKILKDKGYAIDKIVLSPSRRTRDTAAFFIKEFQLSDNQVEVVKNLYHGEQEDYEETFAYQDDTINNIMMIGHNPGITYMVNNAQGKMIDNVPTTGIVILEDDVEKWENFSIENSTIIDFLIPKEFK